MKKAFDDPHPVKLYDLSLPLEERLKCILYFDTIHLAALYVGCSPGTIRNNLGSRVLSHRHGKRFAVRAVKREEIEKRA